MQIELPSPRKVCKCCKVFVPGKTARPLVRSDPYSPKLAGVASVVYPSGNEDGVCVAGPLQHSTATVAAVVTITFDRVAYLQRHLDSLLAVHGADPANRSLPLISLSKLDTPPWRGA